MSAVPTPPTIENASDVSNAVSNAVPYTDAAANTSNADAIVKVSSTDAADSDVSDAVPNDAAGTTTFDHAVAVAVADVLNAISDADDADTANNASDTDAVTVCC